MIEILESIVCIDRFLKWYVLLQNDMFELFDQGNFNVYFFMFFCFLLIMYLEYVWLVVFLEIDIVSNFKVFIIQY